MAQITPEGSGGTFTDLDTRAVSGWSVEAKLDEQKVTVTTSSASGKALLDISLIRADGSKVTASRVLEAINLVTDGQTISTAGDYTMQGNYSQGITINAEGVTLTLKNASLNTSGIGINVAKSATIKVSGENNTITSNGSAGIYVAQGNTVTITGNGRDDVLTVKGGDGSPGIGGYKTGVTTAMKCGNIEITKVRIDAYGSGDNLGNLAPGIGGAGSESCGTITIDNATVYAYGHSGSYSSSAIGAGFSMLEIKGTFQTITIRNNSEVSVQRGDSYCDYIGYSGFRSEPSTGDIIATIDNTSTVIKLN